MSIEGYEHFTYEGYTLGGELPTLYFKEGRYTQVHEEPTNVGWHPNHTEKCYRVNISPQAYEYIMRIDEGDPREVKFAQEVIAGNYTDNSANGKLCECFTDDDKHFSLHVSRGRLIRPGDEGFNEQYNTAYALNVLKNGKIAGNE